VNLIEWCVRGCSGNPFCCPGQKDWNGTPDPPRGTPKNDLVVVCHVCCGWTRILQWAPTTIRNYFKYNRLLDLLSFNIRYSCESRVEMKVPLGTEYW
jgi:hypothetical protein